MENQLPDLSAVKMERASSPLMQAHLSLPVQPPKGRGRPRASYAQTGEFDLGLIREYRSRPALYDRSNKRFKDKIHVAQLWMQISHKLGYDVSILRERMITLRNRYNIEKRRVENNSMSAGGPGGGSQWPLYENLSFLSEHIRTRRSYKTQCKSLDGHQPDDDDEEEAFDVDDLHSETNGPVKSIKHELDHDYDDVDDYDCDRQLPVTTVLSIPNGSLMNGSHNGLVNGKCGRQLSNYRQPELIMSLAKPKRAPPAFDEHSPAAKRAHNSIAANAAAGTGARNTAATSAVEITATAAINPTISTYPKFRAFGEFVSLTLNELPHAVSMRLVEKFTRELVQATIVTEHSEQQKHDSVEPSSMDEVDD